MVYRVKTDNPHSLPTTNTIQVERVVQDIFRLISNECADFLNRTSLKKKDRKRIENIHFYIREVLKNIMDANAENIEIECSYSPDRWTMQITFIDDGDGIHALWSKEKMEQIGYFGWYGCWENLLEKKLPKRSIFPFKKTLRKTLNIPYRYSKWYRRYSDENGSRTILRLR